MKRRTIITALSTVAIGSIAGCSGVNVERDQPTSESVPPAEVQEKIDSEANMKLARAFAGELKPQLKNFSVYITNTREIAADYDTTQETASGLEKELYNIAEVFAEKADQHGSESLTVNVDQVQMFVPVSSVQAFVDDNLNTEAFLETVQIMGVEDG